MEIDIREYLSEDQMKDIAIDEWRRICREACNGNSERIIGNIAHEVVTAMVSEALGDDANEQIKSKAIALIDDLSVYSVFKRADAWDRGESAAYSVLMEAVSANRDLVDAKVRSCINNLSKREALEVIKSGVIQINPSRAA
ncbi:hypothetical protein D3C87_1576520 [compost metagenome]